MAEAERTINELFVSYSRVNKVFVGQVVDALKQRDVDPWFDADDIPKSAEWWREIQLGILNANAFAFVISSASLRSEVCSWELAYAIETGKKIIPVMHEDVFKDQQLMADIEQMGWKNPAGQKVLAKDNWEKLQSLNFIFITSEDMLQNGVDEVLKTARTDLDYLEQHTRLLRRASDWEQRNRDMGYLLKDSEIKDAQKWLQKGEGREEAVPTPLHKEYIESSQIAHKKRQRRLLLSVLSAVAMIILAGLFALYQTNQAQQNKIQRDREARVVESLDLSAISLDVLAQGDYQLALNMALIANSLDNPPIESQLTLADVAFSHGLMQTFDAELGVFSPDETHVIYTSGNMLTMWNIFEHQEAYSLVLDRPIQHIDASNDVIAVLLDDGQVQVLNLADGSLINVLTINNVALVEPYSVGMSGVGLSDDGVYLVAIRQLCGTDGNCDKKILLWDLRSNIQTYVSYPFVITDMEWLPDNQHVVLGLESGGIGVWDIFSNQTVDYHSYEGGTVTSNDAGIMGLNTRIAINGDGNLIAAAVSNIITPMSGYVDPLQIWDIHQGDVVHRYGNLHDVFDVAFHPSGEHVISEDSGGFKRWNSVTGDTNGLYAANDVISLDYSPNGNFVLVHDSVGLHLWDFRGGTELQSFDFGFNGTGTLSPVFDVVDENTIVLGGEATPRSSPVAKVVDITTGKILYMFDWHDAVKKLAVGGDYALEIGVANVYLLNLATGESIAMLQGAADGDVSPDGNRLLLVTDSGLIVKDTQTQQTLFGIGGYTHGEYLPDGRIAVFSDSKVAILDAQGNVLNELFGYSRGIVSPDGRLLFTLPNDCEALSNRLSVVEIATGKVVSEIRAGGCLTEHNVAFSPDSASILTGGSEDGSLRLWDVETGDQIRREKHSDGYASGIVSVAFLPDGQSVISASTGGVLRVWQMPSTLDALRVWIEHNRVIDSNGCSDLAVYEVKLLCQDN